MKIAKARFSPVQQSMWLHGAHTDAYWGVYGFEVGSIDISQLIRSWRAVVAQVDVLRLGDLDQECVVLHDSADSPPIMMADMSRVSQRLKTQDLSANRGLNWFQSLMLIKETDGMRLVLSAHHALLDNFVLRGIFDLLASGGRGATLRYDGNLTSGLRALDTHKKIDEQHRDFWSANLGSNVEPARVPRTGGATSAGKRLRVSRDLDLEGALSRCADTNSVSRYAVLLVAFARALEAVTGEPAPLFGLTAHGRARRQKDQNLLFPLLSTVPIALRTGGEIVDVLRHAGSLLAGVNLAASPSAVRVIDDELASPGLFDFDCILDMYSGRESGDLARYDIEVVEHSHYPLAVRCFLDPVEDYLRLECIVGDRRISGDLATHLVVEFRNELAFLTQETENRNTNDTVVEAAPELDELLNVAAFTDPTSADRVAILEVLPNVHITYRALAERVEVIRQLFDHVPIGASIALRMAASGDCVAAMLACVCRGINYVPLDATLPDNRVEAMMSRAECRRTLYKDARGEFVLERVASGNQGTVVMDITLHPLLPVYTIFTSGSTGNPKGVAITRSGLAESLQARMNYYDREVDRYLCASPFYFDSSHAGIYWSVAKRGTLVLAEPMSLGPASIDQLAVKTVLMLPSLWQVLNFNQATELTTAIFAGEALDHLVVAQIKRTLGEVEVFNEYGPTEATIWSHVAQVDSLSGEIAIGSSIPPVQSELWVDGCALDNAVTGELVISGPTLALGYVGNPRLTARSFLPCTSGDGLRAYLTGDYVKRRENDSYHWLRRINDEVKHRGFRIDLGSIETSARSLDGVTDAIAFVDGSGSKQRLYLIYTGDPGKEEFVIKQLRSVLSAHELPSKIEWSSEVPRLSNGKPQRNHRLTIASHDRETATDINLGMFAELCASVIGADDVDLSVGFITNGGSSLAAIEFANLLQQNLSINVSANDLVDDIPLDQLGTEDSPVTTQVPALIEMEGPYRASACQKKMWMHDSLHQNVGFNNIRCKVDLRRFSASVGGVLGALTKIVARHELLRSKLAWNENDLWVSPSATVAVRIVDSVQTCILTEDALANRELAESLVSLVLVCRGELVEDLHILLSHYAGDSFSILAMLKEIADLLGHGSELSAPDSYRIYAGRKLSADSELINFWRTLTTGAANEQILCTDRYNETAHDEGLQTAYFEIASEQLGRIAAQTGVTAYAAATSIFLITLWLYGRDNDVRTFTPISLRTREEGGRALGPMLAMGLVRQSLDWETIPRELLTRTQRQIAGIFRYRDALDTDLVSGLIANVNCSVLFTFDDTVLSANELEHIDTVQTTRDGARANHSLEVAITPTSWKTMQIATRWDPITLSTPDVTRLIDCYKFLVSNLGQQLDAPLEHLDFGEFAENTRDSVSPWFIDEFMHHAKVSGDRVAICDGVHNITYRVLEENSRVRIGQVGDEFSYAVRNNAYDLIFLLAAFRSGVRLDCQDGGVASDLSLPEGPTVGSCRPHRQLPTYVISSSGTTGVPKRIVIDRQGMDRHLLEKVDRLQLAASDRVGWTSVPTFDIFYWQALAPLVVGATVDLYKRSDRFDSSDFAQQLVTRASNVIQLVPAQFRQVLQGARFESNQKRLVACVRTVVPTGDLLDSDLCQKLNDFFSGVTIINNYGQTECSDDYLHEHVQMDRTYRHSVPLGSPGTNCSVSIRNGCFARLPDGAPGELFMTGDQVGMGYAGNPRLTAKKFVPSPFGDPGARMFRSGDLARRRTDGSFEFLGRLEGPVKVNGMAVDTTVLESKAKTHPDVENAAVGVYGDAGQSRVIVWVESSVDSFDKSLFRDHLLTGLHLRGAPLRVEQVQIPLTAHGKIDRRGLTEMNAALAASTSHAGPDDRLKSIWQDLLQIEVREEDSFFELGGHSLLAAELSLRILDEFGIELTIEQIYQRHTLFEMREALISYKPEPVTPSTNTLVI